jgi:phosphatidylinositol 3-kinase
LICESFILLRRRSQIVITLFDLMLEAKITNGHKMYHDRNDLFKIQDKYFLGDSEEGAVSAIQALVQKSVQALMPRLFEGVHSLAQDWRQ